MCSVAKLRSAIEYVERRVSVMMEETSEEEIEGLSRYVRFHNINSNELSAEEIFSWVQSVRFFKSKARKMSTRTYETC